MKLYGDAAEALTDFEKRMQFINIVRFLLEHKMPDRVKNMLPPEALGDKDSVEIIDNLIMMVFVYIGECTISEEACTLDSIRGFIEALQESVPEFSAVEPGDMSRFIVYGALQHEGRLEKYWTFSSSQEKFVREPVILIKESGGRLELTGEALDFIFRSREIESELDYSVAKFKTELQIKRGKYNEALKESRELVSRIMALKKEMDGFLQICRENIHKVGAEQYDGVIKKIRSLLEDQYVKLDELRAILKRRIAELSGRPVPEWDTIRLLHDIEHNVEKAVGEQGKLLEARANLSEAYRELLENSYSGFHHELLDFDRDLMTPLRQTPLLAGDFFRNFMFCLEKPKLARRFNLNSFYAEQKAVKGDDEEAGLDISEEGEETEDIAGKRSGRFCDIVEAILKFAHSLPRIKNKAEAQVSGFVASLSEENLQRFSEEDALWQVTAALYGLEILDVRGWKREHISSEYITGEFDISLCLETVLARHREYLDLDRMIIYKKPGEIFKTEIKAFAGSSEPKRIEITDFRWEFIYE